MLTFICKRSQAIPAQAILEYKKINQKHNVKFSIGKFEWPYSFLNLRIPTVIVYY